MVVLFWTVRPQLFYELFPVAPKFSKWPDRTTALDFITLIKFGKEQAYQFGKEQAYQSQNFSLFNIVTLLLPPH
jgi:hypothetical protein